MKFNRIVRLGKRARNTKEDLYAVLDAGFTCHIAYVLEGRPMIIPTNYGRRGDSLFFHGSAKNFALSQMVKVVEVTVAVTHLDGIVLARTLFNTSANYRSAIVTGKATLLTSDEERMEGLRIITEHITPGRWDEVELGDENEVRATMVVRMDIVEASVKVREGEPMGDEKEEEKVWSGVIPFSLLAESPIPDSKNKRGLPETGSVKQILRKYGDRDSQTRT